MKITKDEIIKIKPNRSKTFIVDDGKACNSARALVQYVKRCCLPEGIEGYKTEIDWKKHIVTISSISSIGNEA